MKVKGIKTRVVLPTDRGLLQFLDEHVRSLPERSIFVVTSKVVAILEGAVLAMEGVDKKKLIAREADHWLPPSPRSKYKITLTIKNGILAASAGIDESNANGYYILWPKDPQRTANAIRRHLMKKFRLKELGVIVTDSTSRSMRRGTFGVAVSHSGFRGLKNYIGTKDLFGRKLKMTKSNHMEALATAAVLVMGEGSESMPLALIEDVPFVEFRKGNPSSKELSDLRVAMGEDLYAPILKSVKWRKGKSGK